MRNLKSRCGEFIKRWMGKIVLRMTHFEEVTLCPFHHETTPSMLVSQKHNIYYCLGCGKQGKYWYGNGKANYDNHLG